MKFSEMFGDAVFVSPREECTSPYMRKEFTACDFDSAEITVCGLGFFEMYINGHRVGNDLLVPANSQYEKRRTDAFSYPIKDEMSYRVYCMKYDVTDNLVSGKNALGFHLGCGWYNQSRNAGEGNVGYGRIKLCFSLALFKKGECVKTVVSDGKVLWTQSEVLFNNIYCGEQHDCALMRPDFSEADFDASAWEKCEVAQAPESEYFIQTCPPDRVVREITPVLIDEKKDVKIYDCGEAVTGWAVVRSLADGARVTARYAETLDDENSLTFDATGGDGKIQQEVFLNTLGGHEYSPHFCWHAFRYIEVSLNAVPVSVSVVHSDCPVSSSFDSDNEILNWLYKTYLRTQLDNMHCGVPSDCPHIERLGYTGDGQLCCEAVMLMLDSREFYRKWLGDISDCQDTVSGHVQHTAPFMGGGGGPAAWGGAIVTVPYMFWKTYGEKEVLREFLPKMLKYFEYMESRCENGLVYREEDGGWCLGDWCAPAEYNVPARHVISRCLIPESYVNTSLLIKYMYMACEAAEALGEKDAVSHLPALIERHKRAITVSYYSPMYGDFCGDVQGADSYALDIGMGGEKTLKATADKYTRRGMLDTGIVATDILPRVLFENGHEQLAFDLITSKGDISFYYMMKNGATTLWEDWHPERSLNHPMFGPLTRYLFTYLLGITQAKASAGFENILIAPKLVNGLDRASGSLTTVRGEIAVSFVRTESGVAFTVTLPKGASAAFTLGKHERALTEGKNEFTLVI